MEKAIQILEEILSKKNKEYAFLIRQDGSSPTFESLQILNNQESLAEEINKIQQAIQILKTTQNEK